MSCDNSTLLQFLLYLLNVCVGGCEIEGHLVLYALWHVPKLGDQFGDRRDDPAMGVCLLKPTPQEEGHLLKYLLNVHVLLHIGILTHNLQWACTWI